MKKIFLSCLIFLFCMSVNASSIKKDFNTILDEYNIDKNNISISIKKLSNGENIYSLNEKILRNPASVQKAITIVPIIETLGEDYEFKTQLFEQNNNSYLIKLGADPFLTSKDLKNLISKLDENTHKIYIDDNILEKKDWGEGWQWDDDMNELMPKFNSYNLDKNLLKITIMPTEVNKPAQIINPSKYPLVFFNYVTTSNKNDLKITRDKLTSANTLVLEGTVNKPVIKTIPIENLKRYFYVKLTNILADKNIYLKENFVTVKDYNLDKAPINEIKHPITLGIDEVLKNSNNMVSEVMFKLAGAKKYNNIGTDYNGIKMFNDYCERNGLDSSKIRIVDASGVSKNNLLNADFITEFLLKNKDNKVYEKLAKPSEGTLTHRMLPLQNKLNAKTGSLKDVSAIAGFLTAKSGDKYAFCILINDTSSSMSDMKSLEDYLIREAYMNL